MIAQRYNPLNTYSSTEIEVHAARTGNTFNVNRKKKKSDLPWGALHAINVGPGAPEQQPSWSRSTLVVLVLALLP